MVCQVVTMIGRYITWCVQVCLGRRREAVEVAVSHQLWGHAMAIGSRLEPSVGGRVLTAFLQTVPPGDVLHTLVHYVNGKRPEVTKVEIIY